LNPQPASSYLALQDGVNATDFSPIVQSEKRRSTKNSFIVSIWSYRVLLLLCLMVFSSSFLNAQKKSAGAKEPAFVHLAWLIDDASLVNAEEKELLTPQLRFSATSNYIALLSLLRESPDTRSSLVITTETIKAIERYTKTLGEFIDLRTGTIDAEGYLKKYGGTTDPWLDMLLKNSTTFTPEENDRLLNLSGKQTYHALSVSEQTLTSFPDYIKLFPSDVRVGRFQGKLSRSLINARDKTKLKFLYAATAFDKELLAGKALPNGEALALKNYFVASNTAQPDESKWQFELKSLIDEDDCRRLVVETYKVMSGLLQTIKAQATPELIADKKNPKKKPIPKPFGALEMVATPAHDAIIPLVQNASSVSAAQGFGELPIPFSYPTDASFLISGGATKMNALTAVSPRGFFPSAGAVSSESVSLFENAGAAWLLVGSPVLKSNPANADLARLYSLPNSKTALCVANLAMSRALESALAGGETMTLINTVDSLEEVRGITTLLLNVGEPFGRTLREGSAKVAVRKWLAHLAESQQEKTLLTTTPSEYIVGNPLRQITAHPTLAPLAKLETTTLYGKSFSKWLGESEETTAWTYLALVRGDLARSGVTQREPTDDYSRDEKIFYQQRAWNELYAAENALWTSYFGNEEEIILGEKSAIDKAYRTHLTAVYDNLTFAGIAVEARTFTPIVELSSHRPLAPLSSNQLTLDGVIAESEWLEKAGLLRTETASVIKLFYYGYDKNALYFALDGGSTTDFQKLAEQNTPFKLHLLYDEATALTLELGKSLLSDANYKLALSGNIAELRIPFSEMKIQNTTGFMSLLQTQVLFYNTDRYLGVAFESAGSGAGERLPKQNFIDLIEDRSRLIDVIFEVDVRDAKNKTAISIAGNRAELGNGLSQKQFLSEDPTQGDRVLNDGILSLKIKLRQGDRIEYNYYSGSEKEPAQDVRRIKIRPDENDTRLMRVKDYFGDPTR
jgi:Glycosyl hydrolase family 57